MSTPAEFMALAGVDFSQFPDQVKRAMYNIALPGDFPSEAYADAYGGTEVGKSSLELDQKILWNNVGGITSVQEPQAPITENAVFLFRHPQRALVFLEQTPAYNTPITGQYSYRCVFYNPNNLPTGAYPPAGTALTSTEEILEAGSEYIDPCYWISSLANGAWQPHGEFLYPAETPDGVKLVWIDSTTGAPGAVAINFDGGAGAAGVIMEGSIERWDGGKLVPVPQAGNNPNANSTLDAAGLGGFNLLPGPKSGYFAFKFRNTSAPAVGVRLTQVRFTSHLLLGRSYAHRHYTGFVPNMFDANISKIRVLGFNGWLQNQASELNKQGGIVMDQISGEQDWYENYASGTSIYEAVFQNAKEKNLVLETGGFCFAKPSSEDDLDWLNIGSQGRNVFSSFSYPVVGPDYLVMAMQVAQQGAGDCHLTAKQSINFTSRAQIIDQNAPTLPAEAWEIAIKRLREINAFYNNATHWQDIVGAIGQFGTMAAPMLSAIPGVGPALGAGVGALSGIATGVAGAFDRKRKVADRAISAQQAMESLDQAVAMVPRRAARRRRY